MCIFSRMARARTTRRRSPDEVRRVGRPADPGKGFAAIVVGSAVAGKTMFGPPVQKAAAVAIPTAGWGNSLQEALLIWLATARSSAVSPASDDQREADSSDPSMGSHGL